MLSFRLFHIDMLMYCLGPYIDDDRPQTANLPNVRL